VDMKKIGRYPHNGYSTEIWYEYEVDIYPAGRVLGSYYSYPTRPVDIPSWDFKCESKTHIE